ncbi:MAG: hypothetical protein JKY92_09345 [Magnetovibrio sp.]|nr:hypothetical protein [Magnetovibrio sp.]
MNANDFEKIVSGAAQAGWDWFDQFDGDIKEKVKLDQERSEEDRKAIASAWSDFAKTSAGEKAIDALFDATLRRTVYFTSLGVDPLSVAQFGAFREGQNSVAQTIALMIALGRGEKIKGRDTI